MSSEQEKKAPWSNPRIIREILEEARTVAVVGISDNPTRPSFGVARFLIESGYRVIGVNPKIQDVLGTECYPSLSEVPETIDVVDVFRNSDALDPLIDEVIKLRIPYLWLQEGVVNQNAAERAIEAGIKVVMDHCMAKEISRRR
ncbi:MAG: CoA-binding protein [bacterium]|nr:CoA-binding protein [bacterium]